MSEENAVFHIHMFWELEHFVEVFPSNNFPNIAEMLYFFVEKCKKFWKSN